MRNLMSDVRYGIRMLLKRPGTSALAVVALALGIGLTTTMYSIVYGAVIRGLPFEDSHRILHLGRLNPAQGPENRDVPLADYLDWTERQQTFTGLAAFGRANAVVAGFGSLTERYRAAEMTANTLTVLGAAPARGRDFRPDDERPGAPRVILISHRVWETQFNSDPAVVGQTLRVNGQPAEVIGVMPPRFAFPMSQDVWWPITVTRGGARNSGGLEVIGRLKAGATEAAALAEMRTIAAQLEAAYPENKGWTVGITPYVIEFIGREVPATLYAMLGAVFGVLLIACANVTNLQLARALERSKEIAIRTAIGAARWRIIRQMLVEGLLLAAAGATIGVLIALAGVRLFNAGIADTNPPFWIDIRVDRVVLFFVALLAVGAAVLSTLVPALRASRRGSTDALKDQSRSATSLKAGILTRVLVGGAVMLSTMLLIVSGLMIKSVVQIGRTTYAFDTEHVLFGRTTLDSYKSDADRLRVSERLLESLRTVGGARDVAIGSNEPGNGAMHYLIKDGQVVGPTDEPPAVMRVSASPSYFSVLKLAAVTGKLFTDADGAGAPEVVVITQDLADRHFPGESPLGKRIRLGRDPKWPYRTIIGVVPALASTTEGNRSQETAFVPMAQAPTESLTLFVSTNTDPLAAGPDLRRAVRAVDQDLAVFGMESLAGFFHRRGWAFRVFGSLFMAFGFAALLMAVAGLYGVLAFGVRLRTQEIGVRLALGADRRRVARMVVIQGMRVVGIGLAAGAILAYFASPLMAQLFFNVTPRDTFVFGTTIAALATTGFLASIVPAMRAASVDPIVALRND